MYFIPVRLYGALDYLFGLFLITCPWLFNFANNGPETMIPVVLGINLFLLALVTNAEWGIAKIVSFETHLIIDTLAGLFLAGSPWVFNFVTRVYAPHLIIGLATVFVVAVTKRGPVDRRNRHHTKVKLQQRHA